MLLPEEVVLLMEKRTYSIHPMSLGCVRQPLMSGPELAVLIDDPNAHTAPSTEALADWNAERELSARHQIATAEAEKVSEKTAKLSTSEEAIRTRKEREAKRAAAARAKALAEGVPIDDTISIPLAFAPTTGEERSATPRKFAAQTFNVTIPASSSRLGWYNPSTATYSTLDAAREAGVWTYPVTPYERAKCRVFQDLWEKGNFMGGGIKFGGDFLIYPGMFSPSECHDPTDRLFSGDPLRYHSHFVATVVESPKAPLTPMEIVAHGRLGTATKKSHLFCEWDEDTQQVTYFSVEWAGFG